MLSVLKMRGILLGSLLHLMGIAFAQSSNCDQSISGKILDADTKDPLPYATVKIIGTSLGIVTDEEGNFVFSNICKEELDIEVRFIGYKTVLHHHDFHHASPIIYLAPEETLLESVVVEKKLNVHELKTLDPVAIQIKELDAVGINASDLMSQAAGVSTLKTGQNVVKPIVHGLHSNRVLIVNNGVRHSYQAWGTEHGVEIDASQIDRISLIKGASTVRYGAEALGGVILFNAPKPTYATALNGKINGGFQSNGRSISGGLSLNEGYKRIAWNASVSGTKQGDLKAANYQLTNTGKEEFAFTAGGKFHFSAFDLDLFVSHFDQKLGILRGSVNGNLTDLAQAIAATVPNQTNPFDYAINTPHQETDHDMVKVASSVFVGNQQFDLQYAFQRNIRKEFDVRRGTNNERPAINLELFTHTIDLDWDHPSRGQWAGTYGAQYFGQNNDNIPGTNTIPFVPNFNTNSVGIFGIESYISGKTTYEAGVRFDLLTMDVRGRDSRNNIYLDNITYENLTFTFGFVKQFNEHVSFRSNVGTAWRAPNVSELYSFGKHQSIVEFGLWRYRLFPETDSISTSGVLSNDQKEVKSERGIKWISTLQVRKGNFELEATPYVNWIKNFFFTRPYGLTSTIRGTFPYFIHDQTDARYAGLDVSLRHQLDEIVETELKISYVHAKDTRNNQFFVGIPPLNIQASFQKKIGNFSLQISPEWTARQINEPAVISPSQFELASEVPFDRSGTFDFLKAPDAFFLLNMSVGYEEEKLAVKLEGTNLLNASYRRYTDSIRYFADDTGINIGLFASYQF